MTSSSHVTWWLQLSHWLSPSRARPLQCSAAAYACVIRSRNNKRASTKLVQVLQACPVVLIIIIWRQHLIQSAPRARSSESSWVGRRGEMRVMAGNEIAVRGAGTSPGTQGDSTQTSNGQVTSGDKTTRILFMFASFRIFRESWEGIIHNLNTNNLTFSKKNSLNRLNG